MKKDYKAIYFDNYDYDSILSREEFDSILNDNYSDEELEDMTEQEKEERYYEECNNLEQDEFDNAYNSIMNYFDNNIVLAKGSCGRWNGTSYGVALINYGDSGDYRDMKAFLNSFLKDCDYFKIGITRDNKIFIKASHHDGTNYTEFKILSSKGEDLCEGFFNGERLENYSCREFSEKLWKSKVYSNKLDKDFNLFDYI